MKEEKIFSGLYRNVSRFLLLLVITLLSSNAYAQNGNRSIIGIVKDDLGEPLPGAHIATEKVASGDAVHAVATDLNGHFELSFPSTVKQITVSYIGFKQKTITLTNSSRYEITLESDAQAMDEVVVNGMFTRKANTFSGSVTTVKGDELRQVGNTNVLQSLKNIDASFLQIENLSAGSNPNATPDFQMRGSTTINDVQGEYSSSANQPLFILDGFETELTKILDLDMNQVESLTLLKDATAKAIYGSKAANGVVVIETKRPTAGRMKVTYTGGLSIEAPDLSSYDLCNAAEKLEVERLAGLFTASNGSGVSQISLDQTYANKLREVLAGVNTDWLAQPTRVGIGQKHSLYLEGGDNSMLYGVDLSYNNVEGAMKGSDRTTFSGGLTLSYRVKNLTFRNKLTIDYNEANESPYGDFSDYAAMNPYSRIHDEDGNLIQSYSYTDNSGSSGTYYNPIYNTTLNTIDESTYTTITNNFYLEWQIKSNLRLTGRFGIVRKTTTEDVFKPANHTDFIDETDEFKKGSYSKSNGTYTDVSGDLGISWSTQLGKHLIFLNGQASITSNKYSTTSVTAVGFPNDYMNDISYAISYDDGSPTGTEGISRTLGGVLSANYSYDERYLLDLNYRLTGSSETSKDERWSHFWSVGGGWNVHNESFMKDVKWLDRLKLRASVGYTGSQGFSSYDAITTFSYYTDVSYNGNIGSYLYSLANPGLSWQEVYDINLGVDFNMFNNRLSGRFDYYISNTDGMITSVTVPYTTGFSTYIANLGKVENKGIEAYLNYKIYENKRNYINVYGSIAHNTNKLKKISNSLRAWNEEQDANLSSTPAVKYYEGCSMNAIWAVKSLGIDPQTGQEIFVKKDGTVTYDYDVSDQVVCGDTQPKYNGNLGINGEIKCFGFSIATNYRWGGQIYNSTLVDKVENAALQYNVDRRVLKNRWKEPGDISKYKAISDQSTTYPTSRFVEDYNTFTISSISIYYDFRDWKFVKNSFLERLKISAYTEDLYTFSSVEIERGTSYPYARNFSFSVQVTF